MEKVVLLQRYENPEGKHEIFCSNLALAGARNGFDIIGMHKDKFDKDLLHEAEMIIITDFLSFHTAQKIEIKNHLLKKDAQFVRIVTDLSEIEANDIDRTIYILSKKNYFCSPKIFKKYLEIDIHGAIAFLAGKIDDSWQDLPNMDNQIEEKTKKAIKTFWHFIDVLLQRKKILDV